MIMDRMESQRDLVCWNRHVRMKRMLVDASLWFKMNNHILKSFHPNDLLMKPENLSKHESSIIHLFYYFQYLFRGSSDLSSF